MCGSEGKMFKADIEGSMLIVCEKCASYGKNIEEIKQEVIVPKKIEKKVKIDSPKKEIVFIVVGDFAERIKRKRESIGMKQEDFAKMLNEKVSLIHQIETKKFTPSIQLARKLEKALNIELVEQHEEVPGKFSSQASDEFTIGDFIKINKK